MSREPEQDLTGRPSRARYDRVRAALERRWRRRRLEADRMMREVVDGLWDAFGGSPYCWCGFYLPGPGGSELVLGAHREKAARSPIAMSGVCGEAFKTGLALNAPDVKAFRPGYVPCVPGGLSELALPVFDREGAVWAVFVACSESPAAFDEMDKRWLERILKDFREIVKP